METIGTGQRFANALAGFGAGLSGDNASYQQGLRADKEAQRLQQAELSQERIQAGLQDAFMIQQALSRNEPMSALEITQNRTADIIRLGGDPKDTMELQQQIKQGFEAGDFSAAMNNVTDAVNWGQANGALKLPAAASDSYTLSPGQTRFQGSNQVASVPDRAPSTPEKIRLATEAGLKPGTSAYNDFLLGKGDNAGGDMRSRKISDAMRLNAGLSEQKATKIVDGQATFELNEKTGKMLYTDLVTGAVNEVAVSGGESETPKPAPGQTLMDLADVATGPAASLTAKSAGALSFFGINPDESATGAQQTFDTQTTALIRALSINPRFPVAEMERIQKEVNIKPSFLQGAGTLKKKMRSLDEALQVRLSQAERDFNDPNLDVETRQAQGANASALKNFLAIAGANQEGDPIADEISQLEEELGLR